MNILKHNKGFTLIELLIVIALLGALAVGLLAALDPFEQLKKGTDTSIRNTVSELQGAIIRYYAIKSQMPWCADVDCGTFKDSLTDPLIAVKADTLDETITNITTTGELKSDFTTLAGATTLSKIVVFGSNANGTIQVCYKPSAKSFIQDPNTKFDPATGATGCVADATNSNGCLWCVK